MTDRAPTTLSEQVYVALRADLLRGLLQPGSKLKLSDFSARFSVSLSVVREAMARLAEQGLVQSSPQRGFWVTPLSIKDLRDLTRARVLIETLALRESIASGAPTWESTVLTSHHTLDKTPMVTADGSRQPALGIRAPRLSPRTAVRLRMRAAGVDCNRTARLC